MERPLDAQPELPRSRHRPSLRPTRLDAWLAQARRDARMLLDGLRGIHPSPLLPRRSGRRDALRAERDITAQAVPQPIREPLPQPPSRPEPEPVPGRNGGTAVIVCMGDRTHEVIVQPDETILQATLAAGLPMPFSCTLGGCGACKVALRAGDVALDEPNCLTPAEQEAGEILTCVGRPLGPITIEVDAG